MKIAPAGAERFMANIMQEAARVVLLYGPDAGASALLADSARNAFMTAYPEGEVFSVSYDTVKRDIPAFRDELYARSFFVKNRLFKLSECSGVIPKDIISLLESYDGDDKIILTAGELTPSSALRKFAEKNDKAAAIACYKDDARALGVYITRYLQDHNMQADRDALMLLTEALPGDRMMVTRELEKLAIYTHGEPRITRAHVAACVDLDGEAPLNTLCNAVFEGNAVQTAALYRAFLADNGSGAGVAALRTAQTRTRRLLELGRACDSGMAPDEAVKQARPPIFFKDAPSYIRQLRRYTPARLRGILSALQEAEIKVKSSSVNPDAAGLHALLLSMRAA